MKAANKKQITYSGIGGQAVIEGVMMRNSTATALAVRGADGNITIERFTEHRLKDRHKWANIPILRGVINFVESLMTGFRALSRSMDLSGMLDVEEADLSDRSENQNTPAAAQSAETLSQSADPNTPAEPLIQQEKTDSPEASHAVPSEQKTSGGRFASVVSVISAVLGVGLAVLLFLYLPSFLFDLLRKMTGRDLIAVKSLFEGTVKILIFIGYVALISRMKDIRRLFRYHGAEHKTLFCYERGLELTVENVRGMRRFHPRCGTSFLLLMIVVSILINGVLLAVFPALADIRWLWVLIKLLMIPLVCGFGYELLKMCGKYDNIFTRIVSAPGLWIQRLTTKEPDDAMMEVAIVALKAVLPETANEPSGNL